MYRRRALRHPLLRDGEERPRRVLATRL